jgi:hypothetical protein
MVPRSNILLALFFLVLAVAWAVWQQRYGALVPLALGLVAFAFFFMRAKQRDR